MGGSESKQPPGPPPLLPEPWRNLDWGQQPRDEMKNHVEELKVSVPEVKRLRILIYGPVGAGKSSFINSIDSIFQERMASRALAETCAGHSCTMKYKAHKIKHGKDGTQLPFVMCDVMGLQKGDSAGVQIKDLNSILEGHINDDYKFDPTSACSEKDKGYNKDPDLKDKVHCLVSVIPADSLLWCGDQKNVPDCTSQDTAEDFITKFKRVREHAKSLDIPQVVILSKVDEACPNVKEDLKVIYRSTAIKKKIQHCSNNVGVPMNCIFPVKNYHEEIHLNDDMDVLLLSALTNILNFANDYVEDQKKKEGLKSQITQLSAKLPSLKISKDFK